MQSNVESLIQSTITKEIGQLTSFFESLTISSLSFAEMEMGAMSCLLGFGRKLLGAVVEQKSLEMSGDCYVDTFGEVLRNKGAVSRNYLSLFGPLEISRMSYWSKGTGKVYPLDTALRLSPECHWSYTLQDLLGGSSSECDYAQSVYVVNRLLGLNLSGKSAARNVGRLGAHVPEFYALADGPPEKEAGSDDLTYMSASFDGKGVPKVMARAEHTEDNPKKRLGKGEKRGTMQMATVSATSFVDLRRREPISIIRGLMGGEVLQTCRQGAEKAVEKDKKWHRGIHRRAFLADQAAAVDYGLREVKRHMRHPDSRFVVPIDAGAGLEERVLETVDRLGLKHHLEGIVLDIVHVSEYVWDAANAVLGEKSGLRHAWVEGMLLELLDSKTDKVIDDLISIMQDPKISDQRFSQLNKVVNYFINHQHKMDYKKILQKGLPISSAMAESTCKHLVKDRMENSGMRWKDTGAQNILDLRAVFINQDMNRFIQFVVEKEQSKTFKKVA